MEFPSLVLDRTEDPESILLKQRLLKLQQAQLSLAKKYGLIYYKPHPKQEAFHSAALYTHRLVRAGNRFGKSTVGNAEDCAFLQGERVWLQKTDPGRTLGIPQKPNKILVICASWDKVDETFTSMDGEGGKLFRSLPRDFIEKASKNHEGIIDQVTTKNGSMIKYVPISAFIKDPKVVESADWDGVHVDEPCPEAMFKGAARGLMDREGKSWFTLTPLTEFWINDMFFTHPKQLSYQRILNGKKFTWAITGSTNENHTLSATAIEQFKELLTPEEIECRTAGVPLHLTGLIYKEFQDDVHIYTQLPEGWLDYDLPPLECSIYVYIDPHPQTPSAVLFLAVDPKGRHWYFNELFAHLAPKQLADVIYSVVGKREVVLPNGQVVQTPTRQICVPYIDPAAYTRDAKDWCFADDLIERGLICVPAPKDLVNGIPLTKAALLEKDFIHISPRLKRFLWERGRYSWKDKQGVPENKPVDRDDHMMENFYRSILTKPIFIPKSTPNPVEDEQFNGADLDLADLDAVL